MSGRRIHRSRALEKNLAERKANKATIQKVLASTAPMGPAGKLTPEARKSLKAMLKEAKKLKRETAREMRDLAALGQAPYTACVPIYTKAGVKFSMCQAGDADIPMRKVRQGSFEIHGVTKDGEIVANLLALTDTPTSPEYHVAWVWVDEDYQSRKIGTALYEAAAAETCYRKGTLKSDFLRSEFSEGFWVKQAKKGRAKCLSSYNRTVGYENYFEGPWDALSQERKDEHERRGIQHPLGWKEWNRGDGWTATPLPGWSCAQYELKTSGADSVCLKTLDLRGLKKKRR